MKRLSFLAVFLNVLPGLGLIYVGGDHIFPDGTIRNRIRQGLLIFFLFACTALISIFIQWFLYKTLSRVLPASYRSLLLVVIWWLFFISSVDRCYWAAVTVNVQAKLQTIVIDERPAREKSAEKAAQLNLIPGVGRLYVGGWLNVVMFLVDLALYPVAILTYLLVEPLALNGLHSLGLDIPPWPLAVVYFLIVVIVSEVTLYREGQRSAENHNEAYFGQ